MKARINNKTIEFSRLKVPNMNYGQMQRWEDFVPLRYSIEIDVKIFRERVSGFFQAFRQDEIEDNDVEGFPELQEFKQQGWPDFDKLLQENTSLLAKLLIYNQYDILHLLLDSSATHEYYYSVNSVDKVRFGESEVVLEGICFQSDYVEHTNNYKQTRNHALLKAE